MKIVIAGARGRTAQLLVPRLVERGHEVAGLIRRPQQEQELRDQEVEPIVLDLAEASVEDYAQAFGGADVVVWAAGGGAADTEAIDLDAAIRAAEGTAAAGVARYVVISTMAAGRRVMPGMGDYLMAKGAADEAIMAGTGYDWTVIRPGWLSDGEPTGRVSIKGPDFLAAKPISRADVAEVIAEVVDQPEPSRNAIFGVIAGKVDVSTAVADLSQ